MKFLLENACAILAADPGVGKTSCSYGAFKVLRAKGLAKKMLVVAPLKPCYLVWPAEQEKWQDFYDLKVQVLHGETKDEKLIKEADVCVINPDGLDWLTGAKRVKSAKTNRVSVTVDRARFKAFGFDTLVIDECFPTGTPVLTPSGPRAIETLCVGDLVSTDIGPRPLERISNRKVRVLTQLELSNGQTIATTEDHPFFTDLGWLPAKYCGGRQVYHHYDLPNLQGDFQNIDATSKKTLDNQRCRAQLLKILRASTDVCKQPGPQTDRVAIDDGDIYRQTELEQRQVLAGRFSSSVFTTGQTQRRWLDVFATWRQRAWAYALRKTSWHCVAWRVYLQLRHLVGEEAAWLSYQLQSRFWEPADQDRNRGGRRQPLRASEPGCQKGNKVGGTWVASVTHLECDSLKDVWNLEVREAKRFYAHGVLVHNCTRFKHHQSGRFKVLKAVHDLFQRRWGLTGSLTANGLLDLFGQCQMIDGGRSFGAYITHFRTQYFTPGRDGFSWVLQPDGEERIQKRVAPLVLRLAATGLPDLVEVVRKFDLPSAARRVYDELEEDMIAELEGRTVVAANAGVLSGKCRQVACGGLYLMPETIDVLGKLARKAEREWINLHDEKTDLVESLVEELQGEPLLVAYEFNHDLARLRKRFPDAPFIGGGVAATDLKAIEKRWNDGSTPLLFGHPSTIAHGLNLQRAGRHVCWHSLTWDYELYDQLIRRLRRRGSQASQIFVHHLVAKQTVDELMMRTIKAKAKGQASFYEALVDLSKKRRK